MMECIVVGVGGFIGAVCRYLIGLIPIHEGCAFPIKTFLINITGAFFIGVIAGLATKIQPPNQKLILFFKIGICGSFTTFSSLALETEDLIKNGKLNIAAIYLIFSMVLGILAAWIGQEIIRKA